MSTTWVYWTTGSTSTATNLTWNAWTTGTITTSIATTVYGDTWGDWNTVYAPSSVAYRPAALTPEQIQAAEERAETARIEREQRQRDLEAARQKAQELLESCLTDEQRQSLQERRYFDVRAIRPDGQETTYRIEQGSHGNVYEVDADGRKVRRFCIQPDGVPAGDSMLAQKLMLETDPSSFERIANITPLRRAA